MTDIIVPVVLGVFVIILGACNMRGNLSSIHWYHRKRVTEENRLPFGRAVGLGTILCGAALVGYACLTFAAEQTQTDALILIGAVLLVMGLAAGLALSLYAMIKYNRGIF